MALAAVAGRPGLNNREVSEIIGLSDQGQISRMMKRLAGQGLVENTHAQTKRLARAWRLTVDGEAVVDSHEDGRDLVRAQRRVSKGGKLVPKASGRRGQHQHITTTGQAPSAFRLTALTLEVLTTTSTLSEQGSNPSNREIAHAARVKDEGQISKLLSRLQTRGLLQNTGGASPAAGNAWQLTTHGQQLLHSSQTAREQVT
jgi:DNA-binding MarR family transcriptional regulator